MMRDAHLPLKSGALISATTIDGSTWTLLERVTPIMWKFHPFEYEDFGGSWYVNDNEITDWKPAVITTVPVPGEHLLTSITGRNCSCTCGEVLKVKNLLDMSAQFAEHLATAWGLSN